MVGTPETVNRAMRALTYSAKENENGGDQIVFSVNDTASAGTLGVPHVVTKAIAVWIEGVNDAPTIAAPSTAASILDEFMVITGLHVADMDMAEGALPHTFGDATAPTLEVRLSAARGRLWLNTLSGISFGGESGLGDGIADSRMVFQGSPDAVNAALRRVRYKCATTEGCVVGRDTVTVRVSDEKEEAATALIAVDVAQAAEGGP